MAVASTQVPVGTAPVELSAPSADHVGGSSVAIQAPVAAVLYVGGPAVTAATGWPIAAGQTLAMDLGTQDRLYGVLASGTGTAYVLRVGV